MGEVSIDKAVYEFTDGKYDTRVNDDYFDNKGNVAQFTEDEWLSIKKLAKNINDEIVYYDRVASVEKTVKYHRNKVFCYILDVHSIDALQDTISKYKYKHSVASSSDSIGYLALEARARNIPTNTLADIIKSKHIEANSAMYRVTCMLTL